jgi:hypothetical protein
MLTHMMALILGYERGYLPKSEYQELSSRNRVSPALQSGKTSQYLSETG